MEQMELDFTIARLGEARVCSPVSLSNHRCDYGGDYVGDDEHIVYDIDVSGAGAARSIAREQLLEKAGPRERICFEPGDVRAGIVTCGGLCPGLNDVIRAIVMCLWYRYGVRTVFGIRHGYRGLIGEFALPAIELTPEVVSDIHRKGGTILGSSRGNGDRTGEIVDTLEEMGINMLFTIGGDGTQKGALGIAREIADRRVDIAVVGVPKTIDNDLSFVQRSFGFETAVSKAAEAVAGAHVEAEAAVNGIGIVKVMGRQSGFIAAHTALAVSDVNFVLVPEAPFELEGQNGLLAHLEERLKRRQHAVVLIAEGAGQDLLQADNGGDISSGVRRADVGVFLKEKVAAYFRQREIEVHVKYIDPSYIIRSQAANANDSIYCARLGANAAHAAMAGKTALVVGLVHDRLVHVPMSMTVSQRNYIDLDGPLWRSVLEATGQPSLMKNSVSPLEV